MSLPASSGSAVLRWWVRAVWAFCMLAIPCMHAEAQTPREAAIAQGKSWLMSSRGSGGSWPMGARELIDTTEALRALADMRDGGFAATQAELQASLPYLNALVVQDNAKLALRIAALQAAGGSTGVDRQRLIDTQNADGGWGAASDRQSNLGDTLLAADALLSGGVVVPDAVLSGIVQYVLATQTTLQVTVDGQSQTGSRWRLPGASTREDESDIVTTASVLAVLRRLPANSQGVTVAQRRAELYLMSVVGVPAQLSQLRTEEKAVMLRALAGLRQPGQLGALVSAVLSGQSSNGSWDGRPYMTAAAIRALVAISPRPPSNRADLAVDALSFPSSTDWSDFRVSVVNAGTAPVPNGATLAIYDGYPNAGGTLVAPAGVIPPLPAGVRGVSSFNLAGFVPRQVPFTLVAVVNPIGACDEISVANNMGAKAYSTDPRATDHFIRPSSVWFSVHPIAGNTTCRVRVHARYDRVGPAAAPPTHMRFIVNSDTSAQVDVPITAAGQECDSGVITTVLQPGQNSTFWLQVQLVMTATDADPLNDQLSQSVSLEHADTRDVSLSSPEYLDPVTLNPLTGVSFGQSVKLRVQYAISPGSSLPATTFRVRVADGDPRTAADGNRILYRDTGGNEAALQFAGGSGSSSGSMIIGPFRIPFASSTVGQNQVASVSVWADATDQWRETNETNNVVTITTNATSGLADVFVPQASIGITPGLSSDPPGSGPEPDPTPAVVAMRCVVGNAGAVGVGVTDVAFYMGSTHIGTAVLDSIAVGQTRDVEVLWVPPSQSTTFQITVRAFPRQVGGVDVPEATLLNNVAVSDQISIVSERVQVSMSPPPVGNPPEYRPYRCTNPPDPNWSPEGVVVTVGPAGRVAGSYRTYYPSVRVIPIGNPAATSLVLSGPFPSTFGVQNFNLEATDLAATLLPGRYEARATVTRYDSTPGLDPSQRWVQIGTKSVEFSVGVTQRVNAVTPLMFPDFLFPGDGLQQIGGTLDVSISHTCNQDVQATISVTLNNHTEDIGTVGQLRWGPVVSSVQLRKNATLTTVNVPLPPAQAFNTSALDGLYDFRVVVTHNGSADPCNNFTVVDRATISIDPQYLLRLLSKEVRRGTDQQLVPPERVDPRESERVHVKLKVIRQPN